MNLPDTTFDTAGQLHRSAMRLLRVLRAARSEKGLNLSRFSVLGRLHQDGVSTATALAAYLRIQPQSVTRLLADLERNRLIVRRPDAADRRQSLIEITEAGTRLLFEEIRDQQTALAEIIAEALNPAEQQMLQLAAGLIDRLADVTEARTAAAKAKPDAAPAKRPVRKRLPRPA